MVALARTGESPPAMPMLTSCEAIESRCGSRHVSWTTLCICCVHESAPHAGGVYDPSTAAVSTSQREPST